MDLLNSYTIGDHSIDIEIGKKVNTITIYLLSGHGRKHLNELNVQPNYIAENLYDATLRITKK